MKRRLLITKNDNVDHVTRVYRVCLITIAGIDMK